MYKSQLKKMARKTGFVVKGHKYLYFKSMLFFWTFYLIVLFLLSCDTEDWSNGCWKFNFGIRGIICILKYIQIL